MMLHKHLNLGRAGDAIVERVTCNGSTQGFDLAAYLINPVDFSACAHNEQGEQPAAQAVCI
jgi:hypothetical protein